MKILVLLMLATVSAVAQSAKVVALSPEDTAQYKALYAQEEQAQKRLGDFRKKIQDKYISEDREGYSSGLTTGSFVICNSNTTGDCSAPKPIEQPKKKPTYRAVKDGWTAGFIFSTDFKFIVPASDPVWHGSSLGQLGCVTLTGN